MKSRSSLKTARRVDLNSSRCMHDPSFMALAGITLAQNFRATSRLHPGDLERCFNKQGDT